MQKLALPLPENVAAEGTRAAFWLPQRSAARTRPLIAALGGVALVLAICAGFIASKFADQRARAHFERLVQAQAAHLQADIDASVRVASYAASADLAVPDAPGRSAARRLMEFAPALQRVVALDAGGRPLWQEGTPDVAAVQELLAAWPRAKGLPQVGAQVAIIPARPGVAGARLLVLVQAPVANPHSVLFVFDAKNLFGVALADSDPGLGLALATADGQALLATGEAGSAPALVVTAPVQGAQGVWQLRLAAQPAALAAVRGHAPVLAALAIFFAAALLGAAWYAAGTRNLRRVRMARRDALLRAQVAQRRRAERKVQDRDHLVAILVANFPGGVLWVDATQQVTACNDAYKRMLDLPAELFAQTPLEARRIVQYLAERGEFGPGDPDYLAAWWLDPERIARAQAVEHVRPDGTILNLRCILLPGGGALGLLVECPDQRQAEQAARAMQESFDTALRERTAGLLRAKENAERAHRAKAEFLATLAHELRTPVHGIVSFARVGGEKAAQGAADKCVEFFERIAAAGARQLHLINNMLDLARLEAGKQPLERSVCDLAALCRDVLHECEGLIDARCLQVDIPAAACDTQLQADSMRCVQVLRNLVSNAIKFSPPGKTIRIEFAESDLPAGRRAEDVGRVPALAMRVLDAGPGIPEGETETIFAPYVQSSRTGVAGGSGLGLAICREIVSAHRGRIVARNRPTGGAEFEVILPRT
ncbi:MAG: PAS-domain containing protein [Rhodocyclaceae bacterium]|nr:PAS-domain containing protein [Rhodocyclaceae bacterium]MBX3670044.1 PAS-domain containing protein [Rhodocyclaceae bacterium]